MPKFFLPFAKNAEQAERVYGVLRQQNSYSPKSGRLYAVSFKFRGNLLRAAVGEEIAGFPEQVGPVLAIVEAIQLLTIHTRLRGGESGTPVHVSPDEVSERIYFDDFPVQTLRAGTRS